MAHAPMPHPPRHAHRLVRWQRLTLYASGTLLIATGVVWLALHYRGDDTGGLPHPLEAWALRLHGLAAFAGLFMLGVLAAGHVPHGWRLVKRRRWEHQRSSGVMLCSLGALLAATGYWLYYFAGDAVRPALGWAHAAVGLTMAVLVASHRRGG